MNQKSQAVEHAWFPLRPLEEFPQILSAEEIELLAEWGDHAANLTIGAVSPASAKEEQFLRVIQGHAPPETRYQHLWLRYLQAVKAFDKLNAYERRVNDLEARLLDARNDISKLESDGQKQMALQKNESDGVHLALPDPAVNGVFDHTHVDAARVVQEMEQIEVQSIERGSKRNELHLPLLKQSKHYSAMSNDQIFDLVDGGIRQRLTEPALGAFNDEYQKRRISELKKSRGLYVERGSGCESCGRPISFCACGG